MPRLLHFSRVAPAIIAVAAMTTSTAQAQQFSERQVWAYRARAAEPSSTLLINKIEHEAKLGEVFHISVLGVHVKNKHAPGGVSKELPHFPVSRKTLELSVTKLMGTSRANPEYQEGYATWRKAFQEGQAGVFTIPVSEIVGIVESTINQ
jgi:hypothetical protein